jgi:hypothetical protein
MTEKWTQLESELARAIYPRSWEDHGAVYEPNTARSIAKMVIFNMRRAGWELVKLRQGDITS